MRRAVRRTARVVVPWEPVSAGIATDRCLYEALLEGFGYDIVDRGSAAGETPLAHGPNGTVDLQVFIERAGRPWAALARTNVFVVNQEMPHDTGVYSWVDIVVAKTAHAFDLVQRLAASGALSARPFRAVLTRHASIDPLGLVVRAVPGQTVPRVWIDPRYASPLPPSPRDGEGERDGDEERAAVDRAMAARDWNMAIHVAGRSHNKGTAAVVAAWMRRPDFPVLHVVVCDVRILPPCARAAALSDARPSSNLLFHLGHVDACDLRTLQVRAGLHVCPSEAEGWGHSINEARASAAVIIGCDGAPMNELVDAACGILACPSAVSTSNRHGTGLPGSLAHRVDPVGVERAVERYMAMTTTEREDLGRNARHAYIADAATFCSSMRALFGAACEAPDDDDDRGAGPDVSTPVA